LLAYLKEHYFPNLESYYDNGASVQELLTAGVEFYPNPVSDILHISTLAPAEVQIINLFGQEVYSNQINAERDISLAHLSKGLYIVVFRQNGNIIGKGKLLLNTDH